MLLSVGFQVGFRSAVSTVLFFLIGFAALIFALAVLFLLLTSFIVSQAILDCLSSTESLISSIWFWMYSVCSFIYMPANWYCAVFSFRAFVFVGFFRLFLEAVFTSARFSLTAKVSHGILYLVLSFVGIHFAVASMCALTKFSYSSFGVLFFVFSCSVICFLILIRIHLLYLCCSKGPSYRVWRSLFLWRFFVGLALFCRDYSVIGGHTLERGVCFAIHCTIFPFLVY